MERLLTATEVAKATGVPVSSVYHAGARGEIRTVKYGRRAVRFPQSAVEQWLRGHRAKGDESGDAAA